MSCRHCGGAVDPAASTCPHCGGALRPSGDRALLLPSGPRGAVLAVLITALLFTGIWIAFDRATSARAPAATAAVSTSTPSPSPSPAASPSAPPTAQTATPTPTPPTDPALAWTPVLRQSAGALVQVSATTCDATNSVGAGFMIGPRRVVTAAHLLHDASLVEVRQGDVVRPARVLGAHPELDLALLALQRPVGDTTLELVDQPVAIGQRVAPATLGEDGPMVVPATVSGVAVTVVTRRGSLPDVVRTDAAVASDVAGAPLLTPTGRVGGVVLADHVTSAVGDLGFALPAELVADRVSAWTDRGPSRLESCVTPTPSPAPTPAPTAAASPTPRPRATTTTEPSPTPTTRQRPDRPTGGWISILESLPTGQFDRADANRRARSYRGALPDRVRVLRSSEWGSLNPGYWVVYTGPHADLDAARSRCERYGSKASACYARRLAD